MYQYPYGNAQQLNLDWLMEQWQTVKQSIDGSLQGEIDRVEAAITDLLNARDAAVAAAGAANTSAGAAAQSAQAAAADAATAAAQAAAANTARSNAAQAANNAQTYANTAQAQATAAQNAAGQAAASASQAAASASDANDDALAASGSATNAATSAAGALQNFQLSDAARQAAQAAAQEAQDVLDSIPEDYSALSADVSELQTDLMRVGYEEITINGTTGKYVNANGGLSNGSSFAYTAIGIPVKSGDTVTFIGRGYSTTVAMIYTCDSDGSNRNPVVMSIDASQHEYRATLYHDGYIGFSWHTGITPEAYITSNVVGAYSYAMLESDVNTVEFQLGNINIVNNKDVWVVSSDRVRTAQYMYLRKGDIIGLTDYTNARYVYIYSPDKENFVSSSWLTKDYTIVNNGYYAIIISNLTDTNQNGVISNLADLFFINHSFSADQLIDYIDSQTNANSVRGLGHPIFTNAKKPIISHRGLSGEAPENTIPAFELAGQANVWGIETDVYEIADGTFVCFHDTTVDRMTDGT